MKKALLTVKVSNLERIVLLDMAVAVKAGSLVYSWGHKRLALAIGKIPDTSATKQALSGRLIPSLIAKGFIAQQSSAHPGHRAEYRLKVLEDVMGNGLSEEWVTDPESMGDAQTVTPLPDSLSPLRHKAHRYATCLSSEQQEFVRDIRLLLGLGNEVDEPKTISEADEFIREYWAEVEHRRHNDEPYSCALEDLSPKGQRYVRERIGM